jgi:hypothetical protein
VRASVCLREAAVGESGEETEAKGRKAVVGEEEARDRFGPKAIRKRPELSLKEIISIKVQRQVVGMDSERALKRKAIC